MCLAQSRSGCPFCFDVANNVVPVEGICEVHNVENTLTDESIYNARMRCHYIAFR